MPKLDSFPITKQIIQVYNTMPASNADSERAFSKLKLAKNVLQSTMTQERLSDMMVVSFNRNLTPSIESVLKAYRTKKDRKLNFYFSWIFCYLFFINYLLIILWEFFILKGDLRARAAKMLERAAKLPPLKKIAATPLVYQVGYESMVVQILG